MIDYLKPLFVKGKDYIDVAFADRLGDTSKLTETELKIKMISLQTRQSIASLERKSSAYVQTSYYKLFGNIKEDSITPQIIKIGDKILGFRDPIKVSSKTIQAIETLGEKPKLIELAKLLYGEVTKSSIGSRYHRFKHNYEYATGGGYDLSGFYKVKPYDEVDANDLEVLINQIPAYWISNSYQLFTLELLKYKIGLAEALAKKEMKNKSLSERKAYQKERLSLTRNLATMDGLTSTEPYPAMVVLELQ